MPRGDSGMNLYHGEIKIKTAGLSVLSFDGFRAYSIVKQRGKFHTDVSRRQSSQVEF